MNSFSIKVQLNKKAKLIALNNIIQSKKLLVLSKLYQKLPNIQLNTSSLRSNNIIQYSNYKNKYLSVYYYYLNLKNYYLSNTLNLSIQNSKNKKNILFYNIYTLLNSNYLYLLKNNNKLLFILSDLYHFFTEEKIKDVDNNNYINNNIFFTKLLQYLVKKGNKQIIESRLLNFLFVQNIQKINKKTIKTNNSNSKNYINLYFLHSNKINLNNLLFCCYNEINSINIKKNIKRNNEKSQINVLYLITKLLLILQPITKLVTYKQFRKNIYLTKKLHLIKKQEYIVKLFLEQITEKSIKNLEKNIILELKKILLLTSTIYEKQINSIRYLNKYKSNTLSGSRKKEKKIIKKKEILITKQKLSVLERQYNNLIH